MKPMPYAEAIAALRAEREAISDEIERLRAKRESISVQIGALENAVTVPKRGVALPGDVIMMSEPPLVKLDTPKTG